MLPVGSQPDYYPVFVARQPPARRFVQEMLDVKPFAVGLALALSLPMVAGCGKKEDTAPPVATPAFTASRARAALGSPLDLTYRFTVAGNAPAFEKDYRVMVHFLDSDGELMWTDDHFPDVPTREWKPGQRVEYTRTMFVPVYPYMGQTSIRVGLYDPETNERLPMAGESDGQRGYTVGTLELLPASENVFIQYKEGWHNAEVSPDNAAVEWQWTKRTATLSLRNPGHDATLYLHFDGRPDLVPGQVLTVKIGDDVLDTYALTSTEEVIRRIPVAAAQFGSAENVDITLEVNQAFVPAQTPAASSTDSRELGLRVFHVFVEPKS